MRAFYVKRHEDVHGNSGTGIVAEGVIFKSGQAVMRWNHEIASIVMFNSIDEVEQIHGHDGKTVVILGEKIADIAHRAGYDL